MCNRPEHPVTAYKVHFISEGLTMNSPKNPYPALTGTAGRTLCLLISVLLFAGVTLYAKEVWETKPPDEWSQRDCQKLLTNSPWAKELSLVGADYGQGGGAASSDAQAPYITYTIRLTSAEPVRQAVVRQMKILNKYDSLPAEQKQEFDRSTQAFLAGPPSDYVVATVSFETNHRDFLRDLLRHWQSQTTDLLQNSVYLSGSKGEKVRLAQFVPVQGANQEFQFVFPRSVDGKEVLQPDDKALHLEFDYPQVGRLGNGKGFIEFKTNKMKINNEVVY